MTPNKIRKQNKLRLIVIFFFVIIFFAAVTVRLGYHMIIKGEEYANQAKRQQTSDSLILAARGTIVDRNGAELAVSATTHTVWIRPADIQSIGDSKDEQDLNLQLAVKALSETLGMEYEDVMAVCTSEKKLLKLAKNVDTEVAAEIRTIRVGAKDTKLTGYEITEDAKRYYPLGAFASHILGSTTDDNVGLAGVELQYNSYLSGLNGRWIKNKDNKKNSLAFGTNTYYDAEDGLTVELTIDQNIQFIVQQELQKCQERTNSDRVICLMMDPKTGDIMACAQTGEYDPNNPRAPREEDAEMFAELSSEEQVAYWNKMWRSFCVSDVYDPGSTFKLITTSIALDSGVTSLNDSFYCKGSEKVADRVLKCWNYPKAHGQENLAEAVMNSCNPVMMALVSRLGITRYYEGLEAFGLMDRSGVDFPGEATNILQNKSTAGPVGLATMSYGQGIAVNPVSLVSAVCSLANDGYLMQPRFVKALKDKDGNIVENFEPVIKSRPISEQTSKDMLYIMQYLSDNGYSRSLRIPGYHVGGKTGTANKPEGGTYSKTDVYGSFIGVAPIEDPKFVILVICDTPKGVLYGSSTAGPTAISIMEQTLRYLNIPPNYTPEEQVALNKGKVKVPDLTNKGGEAAVNQLAARGFKYSFSPAMDVYSGTLTVIDQYPKPGTEVEKGTQVTLYYEREDTEDDAAEEAVN
ncbi:MAG: PASTA domain-containing protein [Clostridia bacterium]|nr:PASTA domain-containing protein [Clostridia bacterium]